jgi:glycosyltransferase involved in cell wall biosynthesis
VASVLPRECVGEPAVRRYVTVFAGARDQYQLAIALQDEQLLDRHVSEWYSPLDITWFRKLSSLHPRVASFVAKRFDPQLPSSRVVVPPIALAQGVASHFAGISAMRRLSDDLADGLGTAAGRLALRTGSGLVADSYCAFHAFNAAGSAYNGPKIVYQIHPHAETIRRILTEELALNPDCASSLQAEEEMRPGRALRFKELSAAAAMADRAIVASSFTKLSLVENGVSADRIHIVPLGVDLDTFHPRPAQPQATFRVLFVGSVVQRKGIKYLLEAWRRLALPDAELIIAGRGFVDSDVLARYRGLYTHRPNVSRSELIGLYQEADVFVLPSLAEGFGLVLLEALACGTPVVSTTSTAGPDLQVDGDGGFVLPPRDLDRLAQTLRWCYDQRAERLLGMRHRARQIAERFSWKQFRLQFANAVALADQPSEMRPTRSRFG